MLGTTASQTVTPTNTGSVRLDFSSVFIASGQFAVVSNDGPFSMIAFLRPDKGRGPWTDAGSRHMVV